MIITLNDLISKEVINLKNGEKLGYIEDALLDVACANITAIIIKGRCKFFGIFGREDDIIIQWCDIDKIGEDTILVCVREEGYQRRKRKGKFF